MTHLDITPIGKPRMTQRDRWKKRKCVESYWTFKDQVRESGLVLAEEPTMVFEMPMPTSWSKKKKAEMEGRPHQQKPDADNLAKALMDAACNDDAYIWHM